MIIYIKIRKKSRTYIFSPYHKSSDDRVFPSYLAITKRGPEEEARMSLHSSRFLLLTLLTLISASNVATVSPSLPEALIAPLGSLRSLKQRRLTSTRNLYTTHYFLQELDHFTFQPNSFYLFYQKYLMNSTYWENGPNHSGPIFVYTGHEADIVSTAEMMDFMYDIAPKFGALLVFIEVIML
jgi:Serine carboxypeptidase S28